jgi:hypothetical protein
MSTLQLLPFLDYPVEADQLAPLRASQSSPPPSGELARIQARLKGFDWEKSQSWAYFEGHYGPRISHGELLSIADLIATRTGIFPDRDARRRKSVLLKWFDDNWSRVVPWLGLVYLDIPR